MRARNPLALSWLAALKTAVSILALRPGGSRVPEPRGVFVRVGEVLAEVQHQTAEVIHPLLDRKLAILVVGQRSKFWHVAEYAAAL
jgi:hypothetical protein